MVDFGDLTFDLERVIFFSILPLTQEAAARKFRRSK